MRFLYYAYGITCIFFCGLTLHFLLTKLVESIGPKRLLKHKLLSFSICLVGVCGMIFFVSEHPSVYCPVEYEGLFSTNLREEIVEISTGSFPFTAYSISVQSIKGDIVVYEVKYLFLGNSVRVFGPDGVDIIKKVGKQ